MYDNSELTFTPKMICSQIFTGKHTTHCGFVWKMPRFPSSGESSSSLLKLPENGDAMSSVKKTTQIIPSPFSCVKYG
jgi:hypothetical protein